MDHRGDLGNLGSPDRGHRVGQFSIAVKALAVIALARQTFCLAHGAIFAWFDPVALATSWD